MSSKREMKNERRKINWIMSQMYLKQEARRNAISSNQAVTTENQKNWQSN